MILGFKTHFNNGKPTDFIRKIFQTGTKIHSLRVDKKNRWKEGMKIDMATGFRTKKMQRHGVGYDMKCKSTQRVNITVEDNNNVFVYVDGNLVNPEDIAINDGFDSLIEFAMFFIRNLTAKLFTGLTLDIKNINN
jgi:hypothetical protein